MSSAVSVKSPESPCPMENAPWAVTRIPCTTASAFTMSTMPGRPRSSSAFSPAVEKTLSGFSASTGRLTSSPFTFSRSGTTCPSISSFQFRATSASCSRATGRRASGGTPGSQQLHILQGHHGTGATGKSSASLCGRECLFPSEPVPHAARQRRERPRWRHNRCTQAPRRPAK